MNDREDYIYHNLRKAKRLDQPISIITLVKGGFIKETVECYLHESLFGGGYVFLTTSLTFFGVNDRSVDLINEYSPKGTFFIRVFYNKATLDVPSELTEQEEIFFYQDFKIKEIGINGFIIYNRIKNVGDLLILLHEIGHSLNSVKFYKNDESHIITESKEESHKTTRSVPKDDEILIMYKNLDCQRVPTPIPRDEYLFFHLERAEDERTAWAYALKSLRQIRKLGIQLEPGLDHISDFDDLIHSCSLGEYEKKIEKEMSLSSGEYRKLQGIYTRKIII